MAFFDEGIKTKGGNVKNIAITAFLAVTLLISTAFADTANPTFTINQKGDPKLVSRANTSLPKIIKACPGLDRYAADLTAAKVSKSPTGDQYTEGLLFEFKVAARPQHLPKPLKVWSMDNNCFLYVSKNEHSMLITKRACHSICEGVWTENDPESFGREFILK